ncbi:MAG: AAA family ATPase [Acidobacteriota bacterium]|nr:AAA family ATPase [Acidobacteriota bacterium]
MSKTTAGAETSHESPGDLLNLPLGTHTFANIREPGQNFLYIDKTDIIFRLIGEGGKRLFLSRPRRFGKSLLVSTLYALYRGRADLFRGLSITRENYAFPPHPVIRLDFSATTGRKQGQLANALRTQLQRLAQESDLRAPELEETPCEYFEFIIRSLAANEKVVILVDEYDKPILDLVENPEMARHNREELKDFYSVLKGLDDLLHLVFVTGISKFSKVSLFSGLNNLVDISHDARYATLLGITEEELERDLGPHLQGLAAKLGRPVPEVRGKLREWYNGYRFTAEEIAVFNPWSLMMALNQQQFDFHWFATGSPEFLLKVIRQDHRFDLADLEKHKLQASAFDNFDIENMDLASLLMQTGYLTISKVEGVYEKTYRLGYPNYEVRKAFFSYLLESLTTIGRGRSVQPLANLVAALDERDEQRFFQTMHDDIFPELPYDMHIPMEKYYQSICHIVFVMLGMAVRGEEKTNLGRIDNVLETAERVYVFEMKYRETAEAAIEQIHRKGYYQRYRKTGKPITLIGINFADRNVERIIWEDLPDES